MRSQNLTHLSVIWEHPVWTYKSNDSSRLDIPALFFAKQTAKVKRLIVQKILNCQQHLQDTPYDSLVTLNLIIQNMDIKCLQYIMVILKNIKKLDISTLHELVTINTGTVEQILNNFSNFVKR